MKSLTIFIIFGILICATAKPTLDVIADILHDIVHEPNQPSYHRPPPSYVENGPYVQNGYNRPVYTQGGYQRPYPPTNGYYGNHHQQQQGGYYPPSGTVGTYGPNGIYDNQGYYQGPPYTNNNNGYNYNHNNGYSNPSQHGYRNRGY